MPGPDVEVGQRVALVHTSDPWTRLRPGDLGTVRAVDRDTITVRWDSGSGLGLLRGEDEWEGTTIPAPAPRRHRELS